MTGDQSAALSSMNRRKMMKYASVAGAGMVAGCVGGDGQDGDDGQDGEMEEMEMTTAGPVIAWPTEDPLGRTFEEEYNIDMNYRETVAGPLEIVPLFTSGEGQNFDALHATNSTENLLGPEDMIVPLDTDRIPDWENVHDEVRADDGPYAERIRYDGEVYGVPATRNADSFAYDREAITETPNTWGVLYDEQYRGETALFDDWANQMCWTALYLKENNMADIDNQNNMTEEEVEAVIDFLIENKEDGQFRTIWQSFENIVNLLVEGDVVASYAFEPVVFAARDEGADIGYPAPKEGCFEWHDSWWMTQGCVERGREEAYYRLADYVTSPEYGAATLSTRGYLPGIDTESIQDYYRDNPDDYDVDHLDEIIEQKQERYDANGDTYAWNNMAPDARNAYTDGWNRFLNA